MERLEQRPQPATDFEIAKIIEWLKKHNLTASVRRSGEVFIMEKETGHVRRL